MHNIFVLLNYLSVFVMIGCVAVVATHESSKMQKLASMVCTMLLFCCIGFLIKIEATTVEELILGQKLVYATVTHSMLFMLLFILEYCRFRIPAVIRWIAHGINLFLTVAVLTLDYHPFFYVRYWAVEANGHLDLMKEYGPLHTVAVGVFGLYMAAAVVIAIIYSIRNFRKRSHYVWRLLIAVSLPCLSYLIPKVLGTDNELQPIAFSLFTLLLLGMVYRSNLYDINNIAVQYSANSLQNALIVFDRGYHYKGCNETAIGLFPFLADTPIDKDIRAVSELLGRCLDGKVDKYTDRDRYFSVSVRAVHSAGTMSGRVLWFDDVTMEHNYTLLLQQQKQDLESRVETLNDISNKDELTGLGNRRAFDAVIASLREQSDLSGLVLAEMDLNGLKMVNDKIGHKAGDELLRGAAGVLTQVFNEFGAVYRIGGDEFSVVMFRPPVGTEELILRLKEEESRWHGLDDVALSMAYGFAESAEHPEKTVDDLMIYADQMMYLCKSEHYSVSAKKPDRAED